MNRRARKTVPLLLLASALSFGAGIILPMVQFDTLYFFSENPSLVELIIGLWADENRLVAIIVGLFSLLFPMVKLYTVFSVAFHKGSKRIPTWAMHLAKWSMMDVLIVALVIYAAKSSGLATAAAQPGIWFYGLSTLTISIAAGVLNASGRGSA